MKNVLALFLVLCVSLGVMAQSTKTGTEQKKLNVLVFSKTTGFRHSSIPAGLKAITTLAQQKGWQVTATEDPTLFTADFLARFDVCVFLNPTMNVLNEAQQLAFESFIKSGKGFVGIHAAADCEYDWKWYGELNGAFFKTHPPYQLATINIENTNHPAMKPFIGMTTFTIEDEWYSFKENPRGKVTVLATLDESSIKKLPKEDIWKMGDHPIIWYHEFEGSRSFYTGFGHGDSSFENEKIQQHLWYAIEWAGKRIDLSNNMEESSQKSDGEPWRQLFNGKDLTGWKHVGPGSQYVEDHLIKSKGGMGLLYWTGEKFGNCTIRVVFRMRDTNSNAGVFIRIPVEPYEEWMPVFYGYEVQIDNKPELSNEDDYHYSGMLYSLTKPLAKPGKPGPEWNTMEITLDGPRTIVVLNGVKVTDYKEGDAVPERKFDFEPFRAPRPEYGYIGLQNHGEQDVVFFKEVAVKPLK